MGHNIGAVLPMCQPCVDWFDVPVVLILHNTIGMPGIMCMDGVDKRGLRRCGGYQHRNDSGWEPSDMFAFATLL